ncbi:MAG: cyclic nucleotide-binding domain-containing protein [Candidatus Electryonea clarkiae]|nr:cyclic nucleotide-binding domain-containing protein [Candidatus Electryonea clarkiae]MDP8285785.1 cyclic nucleotide-binding domain-containing protein [Candidatus Electryonea clarkiae]
MLTVVEKVIFLQGIDHFKSIPTTDLSYLASIADEVKYEEENIIYREGEYSDSMYVVIDGKVSLCHNGSEVMIAGRMDSFGTWALFEDEPRVVTATPLEDCILLRIDKEDFVDLLADNVQITQGILRSFVHRIRGLMKRVNHS